MRKQIIIMLIAYLGLNFSSHAETTKCSTSENEKKDILVFALKNNLIEPEQPPQFGVASIWTVRRDIPYGSNACLYLLERCLKIDSMPDLQCSIDAVGGMGAVEGMDAIEVIGKQDDKLTLFENIISVPNSANFGIGSAFKEKLLPTGQTCRMEQDLSDLYYVELSGKSVLDAYKSIYTQQRYHGFMADISAKNRKIENFALYGEPDGKVDFDPTPGRTWKVTNATYSLSRGMTPEINDVYADQLDQDFQAYFSGSDGKVAPWSGAAIKSVMLEGKFIDITYPLTDHEKSLEPCPH